MLEITIVRGPRSPKKDLYLVFQSTSGPRLQQFSKSGPSCEKLAHPWYRLIKPNKIFTKLAVSRKRRVTSSVVNLQRLTPGQHSDGEP